MSKDKDKKKKKQDGEWEELLDEEKKYKSRKRKFKANCSHVKDNSKSRLEATKIEHVIQCSRCHTTVDLRKFANDPDAGVEDLEAAIDTVKNSLEIIKYRSAMDGDNKRSKNLKEFAARLILDLDVVPEVIESLLSHGKKKDKEKEKKKKEIKFGLDSLAFDRNHHGKKKKNKGW